MNKRIGWMVSLLVTFLCATAYAQDGLPMFSGTSQQIGSIRYANYKTDYGPVSATYQRIGNFEYGNYSNGGSSTSVRIGKFLYTDYRSPMSRSQESS